MPSSLFKIVLVHPEIPPNTGNIIRLCANVGAELHLIEPLGFELDDRRLRRAGLDYHEYASVKTHTSWDCFLNTQSSLEADVSRLALPPRTFALTTKGSGSLYEHQFMRGDIFVFGSETAGLPVTIREQFPLGQRLRIPMQGNQRSLNLSNAAAVTLYEAWRQIQFISI